MTVEATPAQPSVQEVQDWLVDYICSVLDVERAGFPLDASFDTFALDSVEAVILAGMMEERFLIQIDPVLLFDFPTVEKLSGKVVTLFDAA